LVARKTQDLESFVGVMERTQTCVLRSSASKTRNVDDQEDLIAELIEVDLFAVDTHHVKVVD
jgi:hypothetical protein